MKYFSPHSSPGFTLIELLVSVSIMVILIGGGVAGYLTFNDRQMVVNAADEVQLAIQKAQSLSKSGRLGGCDKLDGYSVSSSQSGGDTTLTIKPSCLVGTADSSQISEVVLENISLASDFTFLFKFLGGGACVDGDCCLDNTCAASLDQQTISLSQAGSTDVYQIVVSRGGQITEVGW